MKKFTHAWLAFMAIKRLESKAIPEMEGSNELYPHAQALVKWFKDYRDFVISGAWYPDDVFKDMSTSHIVKYIPIESEENRVFKKLPQTMEIYNLMKMTSPLYGKQFTIDSGNACDRCESLAHNIVDDFKTQHKEEKGNPIAPLNNNIAMRFFILSHYIADCHMPLHCDQRPFSNDNYDVHAAIEKLWENEVTKSYKLDRPNLRFFYDPDGYPLKTSKCSDLILEVEKRIVEREYKHGWGVGNNNTWDYMSAITEYSYLMAYNWFPKGTDPDTLTSDEFKTMDAYLNWEEDAIKIFCDAIDSIARVWLHVWIRYRKWAKNKS